MVNERLNGLCRDDFSISQDDSDNDTDLYYFNALQDADFTLAGDYTRTPPLLRAYRQWIPRRDV